MLAPIPTHVPAGMEPYLLSIQLHLASTLERISPATLATATAAWQHTQRGARQLHDHSLHAGEALWQHVGPHVQPYMDATDDALAHAFGGWHPWQVALAAMALALVVSQLLARAARVRRNVRERGALQCVFDALKRLPIIRGIVKREQEKLVVRALSPQVPVTTDESPQAVHSQAYGVSLNPKVSMPCPPALQGYIWEKWHYRSLMPSGCRVTRSAWLTDSTAFRTLIVGL